MKVDKTHKTFCKLCCLQCDVLADDIIATAVDEEDIPGGTGGRRNVFTTQHSLSTHNSFEDCYQQTTETYVSGLLMNDTSVQREAIDHYPSTYDSWLSLLCFPWWLGISRRRLQLVNTICINWNKAFYSICSFHRQQSK